MKLDLQGHRGCRGLMPENTIPAMKKAIDLAVTTLELDVLISQDRQVVVSHDPFFNENITTTPEGTYLAKTPQRFLYSMPYDSIRKYDVGLKPHPDFPQQQKLAAYKPLLSQLIKESDAYAKRSSKTMLYNIEIKSKADGDGKKHPPVSEFVDLVMSVINASGAGDRITIQSFDPRALKVLHDKFPAMKTSLLIENNDRRTLDAQLTELGFTPTAYSPHFSLVSEERVAACHAKGMKVIPWTVNSTAEMKRLIALKVDGLISDYPNLYAEL